MTKKSKKTNKSKQQGSVRSGAGTFIEKGYKPKSGVRTISRPPRGRSGIPSKKEK